MGVLSLRQLNGIEELHSRKCYDRDNTTVETVSKETFGSCLDKLKSFS